MILNYLQTFFNYINVFMKIYSMWQIHKYKLSNRNFLIEEYVKHVTIFKNGHGIIQNKILIRIIKPQDISEIKRKLSIEDSKKYNIFPKLNKFLKNPNDIQCRFNDFGFWYSSTIIDGKPVVESIIEKYWDNNNLNEIDYESKINPRIMKWVFNINKNLLKLNDCFTIKYSISVPGLFPLENGKFDKKTCPLGYDSNMSSSENVQHYIKKFKYVISFEKGVSFIETPKCKIIRNILNSDRYIENIIGKSKNDNYYDRYIFEINKPKFFDNIEVDWKI